MIHPTRRLLTLLTLTLGLSASLTACFPVMVGGAVMGGLVATDRRTSGTQLDDESIELRANSRIRDTLGDRVHVNVTSYNRRVLLTGEVPTEQDRQLVGQLVSGLDKLQFVVNELAVLGKSTLSQRANDTLMDGKVKAGFIDAKDLFANSIKVVTERGTVYLMGRVTQREADRATDIARSTSGAQKVVRVFEIISEEELRGLLPPRAPAEAKQ